MTRPAEYRLRSIGFVSVHRMFKPAASFIEMDIDVPEKKLLFSYNLSCFTPVIFKLKKSPYI